ncbi:C4-dicarboxylate ABC transporter [Duganella sp. BuS-21]|uniref:SLAC1 family transporter n=1 Tax=Duganella sp. BuS-21 TaxID=2943848 RepID=UPI0035A582FC
MESVPLGAAPAARARPSLRYLPVSLFGSVMSVAGLALAWRLAAASYDAGAAVSNAVGVAALVLFTVLAAAYLAKVIQHPQLVRQEFNHPVAGSFFGTIGISILLLSSVLGAYSAAAQLAAWSVGALATLTLSAVMLSRLLNGNAAPASVAPAWLIAGVGSLDIVVTGAALQAEWTHEINLLAAAVGGVSAIVFFVLIFSRLIHQEPLAAPMRPSKMILVAPFAVGFIAYANLVQRIDMFAALLFYFGLFLFVIVAWRLVRRPAPFSPAWWAIGFPLAALSCAATMYANAAGGTGLRLIAFLLLVLLTVAIAALAARTLYALCSGRFLTA